MSHDAERFWEQAQSWDELIERCRLLLLDPVFPTVRAWKQRTGGKTVGCFPVYTPQELIAAAGALPVSLFGARGQVEIDHADSRIQSFVCSIARSTLELGLTRHLDWMDALVVPSICDVARNLSGVWQHNFPDRLVFYLHLPQNVESAAAGVYYRGELERLRQGLIELAGRPIPDEAVREAIRLYNGNRALLSRLCELRATRPEQWPASHVYALAAAGNVLPRDEHTQLLERALALGEAVSRPKRDWVRVVLRGAFCEQPPLELLEALEEAGCAVVDDDLQIGARFFLTPVAEDGDPLAALADAYRFQTALTPVNNPGRRSRADDLLRRCRETAAQGVLFASPKFCEPALYDAVLLKRAAERAGLPILEFEYEEKMTVFETVRLQAETFVESLLFFSEVT
ncbi:MAG: 2-hydroxyacyl-CoA dehydratase [Acidobacteria bacterium]|nr:2-hydroxyacyl-CoA dehydratase [Acidobacteriota bacterium]